jgi:hypothetical protein
VEGGRGNRRERRRTGETNFEPKRANNQSREFNNGSASPGHGARHVKGSELNVNVHLWADENAHIGTLPLPVVDPQKIPSPPSNKSGLDVRADFQQFGRVLVSHGSCRVSAYQIAVEQHDAMDTC